MNFNLKNLTFNELNRFYWIKLPTYYTCLRSREQKDPFATLRNALNHISQKQQFEQLQYLNFKLLKPIPIVLNFMKLISLTDQLWGNLSLPYQK